MASSGGQQRDFEIATGRSERAWGVVDRSLQLCTRAKTARALFRRFRSSSFSRAARWLQRRWKPRLRLRHQPPRTLLLPLPLQHWRLKTMPLNLPLQHRHPKPLPLPRPGAHAAIGPAWSAAYTTWESFPYAEYRSLPLVPPRLLAHRPSSSVVEAASWERHSSLALPPGARTGGSGRGCGRAAQHPIRGRGMQGSPGQSCGF